MAKILTDLRKAVLAEASEQMSTSQDALPVALKTLTTLNELHRAIRCPSTSGTEVLHLIMLADIYAKETTLRLLDD